jgi:mannose-6-phosphate isomerase-like protein (cupin superfamily)
VTKPNPQSVPATIDALTFMPDRTTTTTGEQSADAFARLADYRDGGIFVGHWAGESPWERHPVGDEIVMIIDGGTTLYFMTDGKEMSSELCAGDLVVVPQNTWHRFVTPESVKVMSVTPQPTEHTLEPE